MGMRHPWAKLAGPHPPAVAPRAGYRQGGVPLPTPPATLNVTAFRRPGGSDTQMLQDALAWAHAQPVDPNGACSCGSLPQPCTAETTLPQLPARPRRPAHCHNLARPANRLHFLPRTAGYLVLAIPPGIYTLTEKLVIKRSRFVLRGAGMGSTVLAVPKSEPRGLTVLRRVWRVDCC